MSPQPQKCPLIQLVLKSLQKLAIEMKTKKQRETKQNQSLITFLATEYIFAPPDHPDRFKSVNIETTQKKVF